jgi:CRP-like cAMP-binding protein
MVPGMRQKPAERSESNDSADPARPGLSGRVSVGSGIDSRLDLLAQVDLFAGLGGTVLRWLAGQTEQRSIQEGTLLVRQGDAADGLYVIASGRVGIWIAETSGDAVQIRSLGPGEVFGEMALLTRGTRSASVRCEAAGTLLYLDQRPFRVLLRRSPDLAGALAAMLSRWLRAQDQALLVASHRLSPDPPAAAIQDGLSGREREVLRLLAEGRSNPEIAATLVLSRFTVNRHISNIFDKIGAANRVEATTYAYRHGLA